MTYEAYKEEMKCLIRKPFYNDSGVSTESLRAGELEDSYPDHAERFDDESCSSEFWK